VKLLLPNSVPALLEAVSKVFEVEIVALVDGEGREIVDVDLFIDSEVYEARTKEEQED